jgi:hypothetical protein
MTCPCCKSFKESTGLTLSPDSDVLLCRPRGSIGRGEVALMECTDLIGRESTDDAVQQATVVEQDKVALLPVMWIHQLEGLESDHAKEGRRKKN